MRVVRLPSQPLDAVPISELDGGTLYHADPLHPSFGWLGAHGYVPVAIPSEGVPDGGILVIPQGVEQGDVLEELVQVVDRLLGPGGCPWDQAQTHESLKRHLLEEAYEVLEAIDLSDDEMLKEELGDLLLQPVMHAQMAKARGAFDTRAVARGIVDKLVRRHPHVFGTISVNDADEVLKNWDAIKKIEKGESASILAGIPKGMASLLRAFEVSKRAARSGFEWPHQAAVFEKLHEEETELHQAIASGDPLEIESEIGDLLFTVVNVARWLQIEPEEALRKMLDRFTRRFALMEQRAGVPLDELSPEQWDELWDRAKRDLQG